MKYHSIDIKIIYIKIVHPLPLVERYSKLGSGSVVASSLCSTKCVPPEADWISR